MSIDLINSIIDGDYVLANELFEERLSDIQEKKLYEVKRMFAANLNEVLGGKTRAQAEKEIRARGMTPRRASDVYPDPRDIKIDKSKSERPSSKPAPVAAPSVSDARAERNRQSWDKLKSSLAAKMDRKSAMEKKRKEFLSKRPMMRAAAGVKKLAAGKVGTVLGGVGKGALGALSDIGSQLEE